VLKTSEEWLSLNTRIFVLHPVLVEGGDSERLEGGRPRDRHSIAGRDKKPILQRALTGCSTHTVFCLVSNGALSPGIRRPGSEADQFLPSSSEVKNDDDNNNNNNIYLLQLGCYPVAVVILHVNKT